MQLTETLVAAVRRTAVIVGLVVFCASCPRQDLCAQVLSPYSEFQAMSPADLATLQVKLTYAPRIQSGSPPSILFTAAGNLPDITLFVPFYRAGVLYVNDSSTPATFSATVPQLESLIDEVGLVPSVTDGNVDPGGYISFSLLNTVGGTTRVFEAVVNEQTGPLLFERLLNALGANAAGRQMVWDFGSVARVLPTTPPASLEGLVSISFSGLRRDPPSGNVFVGRVRLTNVSATTILPPLSLVVIRRGNAELMDTNRRTYNIHPVGSSYVDLFIGSGLLPGASVDQVIRFANPSRDKFDVTFRAFGGPGTR